MNKTRLFLTALTGAAGYWSLTAFSLTAAPPPAASNPARPTVKPVTTLAAAAPIPTEKAATPAPEDDANEQIPPTDDADDKATTETIIDSSESASFNSKDRVAIFVGNVKVVDPRFQLVCDKLTVFLNKPAPAGQNAASTPAPAGTATPAPLPAKGKKNKGEDSPDPAATPGNGSGIDHAVAEGHVVILQKKAPTKEGEEEKISIGRGEIGTFDNKSGDMVLKGWPSLEQNGSSLIATSHDTVMTIHHDSSLDEKGPVQTKLIQHGKGGSSGSVFDIPTGPSTPSSGRRANNATPAASPAASPVASPRRGTNSH